MTIVDYHGVKISPARSHDDAIYWLARSKLKTAERFRWKRIAALTLSEVCGWSMEALAAALGLHKGNVSRHIEAAKADIRENATYEELRSAAILTNQAAAGGLDSLARENENPAG